MLLARSEIIAGIDIGTTKVCVLIAEVSEPGKPTILGAGSYPSTGIQKGVVVDIDSTVYAIQEAVRLAQKQAGREATSYYVGVTGEHIASLNSSGRIPITNPDREITTNDVEKVLEAARLIVLPPDRQILHAIPCSYTVDGQGGIRQPAGMSGTRLEVQCHIVTGATTFLQNVRKCVVKAGFQVRELVLEPIATGLSVLLPEEKELGVCLVDIGGGTSDIAVFSAGDILYSAVIPIGGTHVTKDVAYGLTVATEEAERLKTESGTAMIEQVSDEEVILVKQIGRDDVRRLRRQALASIIEPRMQELFELVQEELEKADCWGKIPTGIVVSGGGSQLEGCAEVAEQVTGLNIRIGYPRHLGGIGDTLTHPSFATGVGLIHYGAQQFKATPEPVAPQSVSSTAPSGIQQWIANWLKKMGF
jgi:cell division protein FtsA